MKKLVLLFFALCHFSFLKSQSDSVYFDLGVNAIKIIHLGMADRDVDTDRWNPYMFTASLGVKRVAVRFGMGYESMVRQELPTLANGEIAVDTASLSADYRLGAGWEFGLGNKWSLRLGADFIWSRRNSTIETKFTNDAGSLVENKRELLYSERGASPFIYMQYHVTPRISIGTELLWRFTKYSFSDVDKSNLNSADLLREYSGVKRILQGPTALFINARF